MGSSLSWVGDSRVTPQFRLAYKTRHNVVSFLVKYKLFLYAIKIFVYVQAVGLALGHMKKNFLVGPKFSWIYGSGKAFFMYMPKYTVNHLKPVRFFVFMGLANKFFRICPMLHEIVLCIYKIIFIKSTEH